MLKFDHSFLYFRVKKASQRFGMVHGISVLLNFGTMAANVAYFYNVAALK